MKDGDGEFRINRLILRSRHGCPDPLLLQMRTASALNRAELQPPWLPACAVLCIRRLRNPAPASLSASWAWESAVAAPIDHLSRSAARPALGAVPANAEAVLFMDRAEMLACLASDWCDGSLTDRWWWRSLLKGADSWSMVLNAWGDAPEYVPAALEHLANRGMAVQFVRNIGSSGLRILLRSVTDSFAMAELAAQVAAIPDFVIASPAERESTITDEVTARETEAILLPDGLPHTAPWQRWVPECSGAGLNPLQQCLLGVGLMLARAPHVARSLSFATAVRQWSRLEPDTERNTEHVQVTAEEVHVTVGESFSQSEVHAAVSTKAEQRS
ncbi:MAG TPA: hypothetical protein VN642_15120, partial [Dongiaceae bacterium]|nr:hypothetical protein [Dongiaceae bacterium]